MRSVNARTLATPTAVRKILEHRRVVRRIADEDETRRARRRDRCRTLRAAAFASSPACRSAPNQPLTWIELTLAVMPAASHQRDDAVDRRRAASGGTSSQKSIARSRFAIRAGRTRARSRAPRAGCARRSRRVARDWRARSALGRDEALAQLAPRVDRGACRTRRFRRPPHRPATCARCDRTSRPDGR